MQQTGNTQATIVGFLEPVWAVSVQFLTPNTSAVLGVRRLLDNVYICMHVFICCRFMQTRFQVNFHFFVFYMFYDYYYFK